MKNVINAILIIALLVGGLLFNIPAASAATTYTESVIDDNKTGSIKLVKYSDPTGIWVEAHGLESDKLPDAIPIAGIEFTYLKVADIGTFAVDSTVGTYYTNLNDKFSTFMEDYNLTPDKVDGTTKYYTAKTFETALELANANQVAVEQFVLTNGTKFANTAADGSTSKDNLSLGLYLIAETNTKNAKVANSYLTGDDTYIHLDGINSQNTDSSTVKTYGDDGDIYNDVDYTSVSIASKTKPYFISVPTTNTAVVDGHEPGTVWMYDIVSYPKNSITDVTKMIVDQNDNKTLRAYEDYEIGDTVNQVIFSGVQALRDGKKHEYYRINDTMTAGLDFLELTSVTMGKRTKNPTTTDDFKNFTALTKDTDFKLKVNTDKHYFEVEFTTAGLTKLDAIDDDYLVVVSFKSKLNKDAAIGPKSTDNQNMNIPTIRWKNTGEAQYDIYGNKIYAFTYQINVKKEGLDDLTKAKFVVQRAVSSSQPMNETTNSLNNDLIPSGKDLNLIKESDGVYHLYDYTQDDSTKIVNVISPDATGKLSVKGVDSEQYVIIEVATENHKNLLAHAFEVVITAPDKGTASLADPKKDSHRDGNITSVAKVSDSNGTAIKTIDLLTENGIVSINIINNDVISLHTGGNGVIWYYVISAILLMSAIVIIIYKKKSTISR